MKNGKGLAVEAGPFFVLFGKVGGGHFWGMKRGRRRLYTLKDWESADETDRMWMHMQEPERWTLSPREDETLQKLKAVWALVMENTRPTKRVKAIMEAFDCTSKTAYVYIRRATDIFGDLLDIDHTLEMHLAYDKALHLMQLAEEEGEIETAQKCLKTAEEIRAKIEAKKPRETKQYVSITITNNPNVLNAKNEDYLELSEAIDYEPIPSYAAETSISE